MRPQRAAPSSSEARARFQAAGGAEIDAFLEAMREAGHLGPDEEPRFEPIRVSFPISAYEELGFLADDQDGDPPLAVAVLAAHHELDPEASATGVQVEDEEEGDQFALYCSGLPMDRLLVVVQGLLPEGWSVAEIPVEDVPQAAITRTRPGPS